jgi:hypothetical protein
MCRFILHFFFLEAVHETQLSCITRRTYVRKEIDQRNLTSVFVREDTRGTVMAGEVTCADGVFLMDRRHLKLAHKNMSLYCGSG